MYKPNYTEKKEAVLERPAMITITFEKLQFMANALEYLYSLEDRGNTDFPFEENRTIATSIRDMACNAMVSIEASYKASMIKE